MRSGVCLCLALVFPALLQPSVGLADTVTATVDGSRTYQVIEGFGANVNHRSWNNNELKPVLDALIDRAGMTLFRVIYDKADWESTNDNGDANVLNWSYYNQVYSSPDFQKMWDIAAYLNYRKITDGTMFNFQGNGPVWMGDGGLDPGYEAEWAEMVASLLIYARNTRHLQFSLVGPGNEQDHSVQGVYMSSDQYITGLRALSQLLDSNGLGDLRFVGPDLANTSTDWMSAMMDDPVVMSKLAHFGLHSYQDGAGGSAGISSFLQQSSYPDRTYWMTEFNVWCGNCEASQGGTNTWEYASAAASYLLYHLAYGASAAMVWEGYDSQYNYYSPGRWSYWGLFAVNNINAVPKTYTPRKIFYTLAQITKFVRPGAQQIDVSLWAPPILVLAFYHPDTGQLTLAGINPDSSPLTLSAVLTNLPPVASLDLYYTDPVSNLCHSATFPVTDGSFAATVPANSVFALVGFDPAKLAVSVVITNPADGASYSAPATIPIMASATTTTGALSQVEFFCGTTNLGEALEEPYSLTWSNVPPGIYLLTASATNSIGNFGVSPGIEVTVVGPPAQISIVPSSFKAVPYGTQQLTASVADEFGTVIEPAPPITWSASDGGVIDANGLFTAGGSIGGPFVITASISNVVGTASVSIATNFNLAPSGLGSTWYSLTLSTDNSPQADAPGINDGELDTDVPLLPGGGWDIYRAYEAAGVIWPNPQAINRVIYHNGSYTTYHDGVFSEAGSFKLQFSPDGVIWTNAGSEWVLSPSYSYNSSASANVAFTFSGGVTTVRGVRCVGRVHHRSNTADSWVAFATEVEAFAAPIQPVEAQIMAQPSNQEVPVGAAASFSVVASGTAPLSYQWQFNGTNLDGAVSTALSLTNVQLEQAGSYSVVVTNIAGAVTSAVATLTVLVLPPAITLAPTNQTVPIGGSAGFSVAAGGTAPLSYQWQFNGTNLDGAIAATLSLTNVQLEQAGGYNVVITNTVGSVTSAAAILTVLDLPPVITLDPTNRTALVAATVNFSVTANGSAPLRYQWQFNGTNLDGAAAETLSLTNVQTEQAGDYCVVVTNSLGSATSAVATLTVLHYPLLLDPRMTTNGSFAFTLSGDTGCSYLIEVSTNLVDWAWFGTLSNGTAQAEFTDLEASNTSSRFYRARLAD
jgi:hypothetical protein